MKNNDLLQLEMLVSAPINWKLNMVHNIGWAVYSNLLSLLLDIKNILPKQMR